MRVGGDLSGQHHQAGVAQGLGRHPRLGVLFEDCVQDSIRHLVGHLVGVALRDGLGSKEKIICHGQKLQF